MALVDYTDSEDSESSSNRERNAQSRRINLKRKRSTEEQQQSDLPPLPDFFHDLYASTTRVSKQDDPSLHAGRQRQIPHVEGQWPTHVYTEYIHLRSLLKSDLGAEAPLHISLSRTLMLAAEQRHSFVRELQTAIEASGVKAFTVILSGLRWVANYENNRWFLVVQVQKPPGDELNKLLRASNKVANEYGQPYLYVPPEASTARAPVDRKPQPRGSSGRSQTARSNGRTHIHSQALELPKDASAHFHVSIGWTLEEPPEALLDETISGQALKVDVRTIKIKVGNGIVLVQLGSRMLESNGLIGS
ncbi:MAG: hypothetical protein Q9225_005773 [Loekoesia sp. 1 TL-2023]